MKQVSRNELACALTALGKLVSRTSPAEAYRCIHIESRADKLRFTTVTLEESLSVELLAHGDGDPLDVIVPFSELKDAVKSTSAGGTADFTLADNILSVELAGGRKNSVVHLAVAAVEWPQRTKEPDTLTPAALPEGWVQLLAQAAPLVDRSNFRKVMQGIHLSREGIAATNGKALLHIPCELAVDGFTLPFPLALLATKTQEGGNLFVWRSNSGDTFFRICAGPWTWNGKALTGCYPNWKQVIPNEKLLAHEVQFKEAEKEAMLSYLKSVPDDPPNNPVTLSRSGNEFVLSAKGSSHQVEAGFTKGWDSFSIVINRDLLIQALQLGHTKLAFADNHMPFMAQGGTGTFVAMPLYFPNPKQEEKKMNETTNPVVTAPVQSVTINPNPNPAITPVAEPTNPLDDLAASIDAFKLKLRLISEESAQLSRKVKEVALSQKQKERDFIQAKRAIERIRMAI